MREKQQWRIRVRINRDLRNDKLKNYNVENIGFDYDIIVIFWNENNDLIRFPHK